jgi:hypothetical protein
VVELEIEGLGTLRNRIALYRPPRAIRSTR